MAAGASAVVEAVLAQHEEGRFAHEGQCWAGLDFIKQYALQPPYRLAYCCLMSGP